ncbi:hypothetical protein T265_00101 [Opisthorchis viverrini]|uniref:Uncharacterized protein n=1 Tax=Opisthorchis viverrini TaxID=6198 RepID=A0A075A4G2_OPIVI|nr:hypothetical protein T265_00101 [Opisthorchis viverrini]KER34251.1 hypothetical protein T265_00101 [Opisthorchis viverrini]
MKKPSNVTLLPADEAEAVEFVAPILLRQWEFVELATQKKANYWVRSQVPKKYFVSMYRRRDDGGNENCAEPCCGYLAQHVDPDEQL